MNKVGSLTARWETCLRQQLWIQASVNLLTKHSLKISSCFILSRLPSFHICLCRPASKKVKPALPSGLLPAASASRVNLSYTFSNPSNPPKTPAVKNHVAYDPNFTSQYGGILDGELADSAPPAVMEKARGKRQVIYLSFMGARCDVFSEHCPD